MIYVLIIVFVLILMCATMYPRTNTIYKNKYKAKVLVIKVEKTTVIVQYVDYDEKTDRVYAITGPQNVGLWKFVWSHSLWRML